MGNLYLISGWICSCSRASECICHDSENFVFEIASGQFAPPLLFLSGPFSDYSLSLYVHFCLYSLCVYVCVSMSLSLFLSHLGRVLVVAGRFT